MSKGRRLPSEKGYYWALKEADKTRDKLILLQEAIQKYENVVCIGSRIYSHIRRT